jgi:hypothetical protein
MPANDDFDAFEEGFNDTDVTVDEPDQDEVADLRRRLAAAEAALEDAGEAEESAAESSRAAEARLQGSRRREKKSARRSAGTIPAKAPKPQDHRPKKSAAQREGEGDDTIVFEHNGVDFTIPAHPLDWPAVAVTAFEDGKAMSSLRAVLGPEQWPTLAAMNPTAREAAEFFNRIARESGFIRPGN